MFPSRRIEADRAVSATASEVLTISTLSLAHPKCAAVSRIIVDNFLATNMAVGRRTDRSVGPWCVST